MSKITIKEIADLAGVSQTAVSFVINNKPGVSEETREKVQKVIQSTKYMPNIHSRRLSFNKSYNICIMIKESSGPFENLFYFDIAKGLMKKSKEYGYNVVFSDMVMKQNKSVVPDIIKNNDTDAIIFLQDIDSKMIKEIDKYKIPYIIIDAHSIVEGVTSINVDYEDAAFHAVNYLVENNHKKIGFIGSSYIPEFYEQVLSGYKRALKYAGLEVYQPWIKNNAKDENTAYKCMKELLSNKMIPTSIFCSGDIFAIGAMRCAKECGYLIPKDISFIGIDDIILSSYFEPKLTTIRVNAQMLGEMAMDMAMRKIAEEEVETVLLKTDGIIVRNSVHKI